MNRELTIDDAALIDVLRGLAVEIDIPPGWDRKEREVFAVSTMDGVAYRVRCSCVVATEAGRPLLRIVASDSQLDRAAREFFRVRDERQRSA
jgi:hypothetical protein